MRTTTSVQLPALPPRTVSNQYRQLGEVRRECRRALFQWRSGEPRSAIDAARLGFQAQDHWTFARLTRVQLQECYFEIVSRGIGYAARSGCTPDWSDHLTGLRPGTFGRADHV